MKVKRDKSVRNVVIFKDTFLNNHINGKVSSRALNMVIHWSIFENNQIGPFPSFTFLPKTGETTLKQDFFLCNTNNLVLTRFILT